MTATSTTELARAVARMRNAQREYFRTRSATALESAKRLERMVDEWVRNILAAPTLFDREGGDD